MRRHIANVLDDLHCSDGDAVIARAVGLILSGLFVIACALVYATRGI